MIVYHGATIAIQKPLVNVDRKHLDFGEGFYMTDLPEQAISWAQRPINAGKDHVLNTYEFDIGALFPKAIAISILLPMIPSGWNLLWLIVEENRFGRHTTS